MQFSRNSINGVRNWCWLIRPGSQSAFQFIPKVFDRVEVKALRRPIKFFHTKLFLYGPCVVHRGIVLLKRQRAFPQTVTTVGTTELSRMLLYAVALRFPFTGTKRSCPSHQKQPETIIPPNFSWHYAVGQVAFSWHPQNPDSSCPMEWSVSPENSLPLR